MHLARAARTHQLDAAAEARVGRSLVAHLRANAFLAGGLAHQPALPTPSGPAASGNRRACPGAWPSPRPGRACGRASRRPRRRSWSRARGEARGSRCISWPPCALRPSGPAVPGRCRRARRSGRCAPPARCRLPPCRPRRCRRNSTSRSVRRPRPSPCVRARKCQSPQPTPQTETTDGSW